ncbi:MAG: NAD(P)-dependent oxidoreductase [Candidatus Omnitrophica bacterium]|nr:NAD(P)-dependent oxidoreductase [Candidatus Omnitrophota bacterium]
MNILVTGGAGYIGAVAVPILLSEGHAVTVLDNFWYGQAPLLDCCHHPALNILRGDARDPKTLRAALQGADGIIPLACLTGAPVCDRHPQEARSVNLEAIQLLLKLRRTEQRVIFPTTNSGYGIGGTGVPCTEESPLRPISLYGRLKVEAERAVLDAGNSVTLRLATVFGISPRMRLDLLVNDFVYRATSDGFLVLYQGDFRRNYIHVRDVAAAFGHAMAHFDQMQGQPYNVGLSDANLSKRELCEEIRKQVPGFYFTEAEIGTDPDQRDYIVSNEKIERTGFRPRVSLQAGIAELVKGYQVIRRNGYANIA